MMFGKFHSVFRGVFLSDIGLTGANLSLIFLKFRKVRSSVGGFELSALARGLVEICWNMIVAPSPGKRE